MAFPTYEKKEDIPKGFEDLYEEKDGKFSPKVPEVPDVTKLNTALETERTQRAEEEKARKKAERELAEMRRKEAAREGNVSEETMTKLREEDERKRREELDPVRQELDRTKAELTKVKKTDRVQRLFLDSGGIAARLEDAMLSLDKRTGLTEDGNTITVLDKEGKLTTTKVEDFLKGDFKKEKPWLYAGSGGSGSGAGGSGGAGGDEEEPKPRSTERQLAATRAVVAGAL